VGIPWRKNIESGTDLLFRACAQVLLNLAPTLVPIGFCVMQHVFSLLKAAWAYVVSTIRVWCTLRLTVWYGGCFPLGL
jgi:hypothetical protein